MTEIGTVIAKETETDATTGIVHRQGEEIAGIETGIETITTIRTIEVDHLRLGWAIHLAASQEMAHEADHLTWVHRLSLLRLMAVRRQAMIDVALLHQCPSRLGEPLSTTLHQAELTIEATIRLEDRLYQEATTTGEAHQAMDQIEAETEAGTKGIHRIRALEVGTIRCLGAHFLLHLSHLQGDKLRCTLSSASKLACSQNHESYRLFLLQNECCHAPNGSAILVRQQCSCLCSCNVMLLMGVSQQSMQNISFRPILR